MRPRHGLALLLIAVVPTMVAGCGADAPAIAPAADAPAPAPSVDAGYVEAAQALFQPVGRLASAVAARAEAPDEPAPSRDSLEEIVTEADEVLARLRATPVDDAALRAQQRRLVQGYEVLRSEMDAVVDSLAAGDDPARLADAAAPFFDALDGLSADLREGS